MVDILLQFFGAVGADLTTPTTFPDLLVWLVSVILGISIVTLILKSMFGLVRFLGGGRFL